MLDNLDNFLKGIHSPMMSLWKHSIQTKEPVEAGDMYCPSCAGPRRMSITSINLYGVASTLWTKKNEALLGQIPGSQPVEDLANIPPSLFWLRCTQCKARFSAMIYAGPDGASLAIFPARSGGLATINTPKNVAYFLNQAYKCQAGGATTGAVLMYRAALEQLLTDQKYTKKNITDKIKDLEDDVKNSTGPKWVQDVDSAFLRVIKDLGNEGIHLNSGDVDTLAVLDANLLATLQILFVDLLDLVYEKPIRHAEKLKLLQEAHAKARP